MPPKPLHLPGSGNNREKVWNGNYPEIGSGQAVLGANFPYKRLQGRCQVCPGRIPVPGNAAWIDSQPGIRSWREAAEEEAQPVQGCSWTKILLHFNSQGLLHLNSQGCCWFKRSSGQIQAEVTHPECPCGCSQPKVGDAAAQTKLCSRKIPIFTASSRME